MTQGLDEDSPRGTAEAEMDSFPNLRAICRPGWTTCITTRLPCALAAVAMALNFSNRSPSNGAPLGMMASPVCEIFSKSVKTFPVLMIPHAPFPHLEWILALVHNALK